MKQLMNVGYGNLVCVDRIIAIVAPESAPIKRIVQESKDKGTCIDATYGRRTKAVLIMDTDHVILSSLQLETLKKRAEAGGNDNDTNGEEDNYDSQQEDK